MSGKGKPIVLRKEMSPCIGCDKRCASPNCHGECEDYKAYRAELDRRKQRKRLEAEEGVVEKVYWVNVNEHYRKQRSRGRLHYGGGEHG